MTWTTKWASICLDRQATLHLMSIAHEQYMKEGTLTDEERNKSFGGQITYSSQAANWIWQAHKQDDEQLRWPDGMMAVCLLKILFHTSRDLWNNMAHHCVHTVYPDVSHHPLQVMGNRNKKQDFMLWPPMDIRWNFCSAPFDTLWFNFQ